MTIDIEKIANLSHLEFTDEELSLIKKDMEDIVAMVKNLPSNCAECSDDDDIVMEMELRSDNASEIVFERDEMLVNAPIVYNNAVAVPKAVRK